MHDETKKNTPDADDAIGTETSAPAPESSHESEPPPVEAPAEAPADPQGGEPSPTATEGKSVLDPNDPFILQLSDFSGPLDLLLHLIKKHEMDIFNIPVSEITERYLAYVEVIRELDLDHAGDFLVMAATLTHIKSKMLLPPGNEDEDEEEVEEGDPREELVRRLLEYQKYKQAAEQLSSRPLLGRDVFVRPPERNLATPKDEVEMEEVSVFQLIEIFQELLEQAKKHAPHQVQLDTVKVEDRIGSILLLVRANKRVTFRELFKSSFSRPELVATFLGILELTRLSALRLYQTADKGEIYLSLKPDAPSDQEIFNRLSATLDYDSPAEESSPEA